MKKMVGSVLLSGALLLTVGAPLLAHAADTTATADSENRAGTTSVKAHFDVDDTAVTPVDPSNPNQPSTDGNNHNGAKPGSGLSLIYVTDALDFGSNKLSGTADQAFPVDVAKSTSLNKGMFVTEVSDNRGTAAGWKLAVTGDSLQGADKSTIKGASISLPAGTLGNSGAEKNGATTAAYTISLDSKPATNNVLQAVKNNGTGVTVDTFDPANIKLNIPANTARNQDYATTLNWSLSDGPAS